MRRVSAKDRVPAAVGLAQRAAGALAHARLPVQSTAKLTGASALRLNVTRADCRRVMVPETFSDRSTAAGTGVVTGAGVGVATGGHGGSGVTVGVGAGLGVGVAVGAGLGV